MDDLDRMTQLGREGYQCSQILVILGMELQGLDSPELVRATRGLCGGLGTGEVCGALSGGACLLGLYAGEGHADPEQDLSLPAMLDQLVSWFKDEYGRPYGGIRCEQILDGELPLTVTRCAEMVRGVYQKVKEILVENGFDLAGPDF